MSQGHRRLSVKEKIDQLERSKTAMNPDPIFDSSKNMAAVAASASAGKKSSPPGSPVESRNTIRVIKQNDADGKVVSSEAVTLDVSLAPGSSTDAASPKLSITLDTGGEPDSERIQGKADTMATEGDTKKQTTIEQEVSSKDATPAGTKEQTQVVVTTESTTKFNGFQQEDEGIDFKAKPDSKSKSKTEIKDTSPTVKREEKSPAVGDDKTDRTQVVEIVCEPITQDQIDKIMKKYSKIDEEDRKKYLDFFWSVDEFHYGFFTLRQLQYRMRILKPFLHPTKVAQIFSDFDPDQDGVVTLEDFMDEMAKKSLASATEEDMRKWFNWLDADQDGVINYEDLRIRSYDSKRLIFRHQFQRMLKRYDSSGNEKQLNFDDFCRLLKDELKSDSFYR